MLGHGLGTAPTVVRAAVEPNGDVHVVGPVGLRKPGWCVWYHEVPDTALVELARTWEEDMTHVGEVKLGGGQQEGAWSRNAVDGSGTKIGVEGDERGHILRREEAVL